MSGSNDLIKKFIAKGKKLFEEAEIDLNMGAYNKAVSAYYFATECYANALMILKKQKARGFGSRLNVISNILSKETARKYDILYQMRVKADHHADFLNEEDAIKARNIALKIIEDIKEYIKKTCTQ